MVNKVPESFDEAIEWILNNTEGIQEYIKRDSETKFIANCHHGLGMWIRNNWGFWEEKGPLYFWFLSLGIKHPDDMSGILLTSAYRKFKNIDIELEEQVQSNLDFWKKVEDETGEEQWPKEDNT